MRLVASVATSTSLCRLWDLALDCGIPGTHGLLLLLREKLIYCTVISVCCFCVFANALWVVLLLFDRDITTFTLQCESCDMLCDVIVSLSQLLMPASSFVIESRAGREERRKRGEREGLFCIV